MPRKPVKPPLIAPGSSLFPSKRVRSFSMNFWSDRLLAPASDKSARLEVICRRFHQFTLGATPRGWSVGDWAVLVLALKEGAGHAEFDAWKVVMGWAHAYRDHCSKLYGVDAVEVARKLRDAGEVACIAVCDTVDTYWLVQGKPTHAERLEALSLASTADVRAWKADQARRDAAIVREQREASRRGRSAGKAAAKRPRKSTTGA